MNQRYVDLAIKAVAKEWGLDEDFVRGELMSNIMIRSRVEDRAIVMQVDDVLITNWVTVTDNDYRKALNDLITYSIGIHEYHKLAGTPLPKPEEAN
jgi:hypothetical protein